MHLRLSFRRYRVRMTATLSLLFMLSLVLIRQANSSTNGGGFDPYQLNGGLVVAVAGRDYCLIATDTRLTGPSGYEILERAHLQSRLWSATWSNSAAVTTTTTRGQTLVGADGSLLFPKSFIAKSTIPPKQPNFLASVPPVWIASAGCQADCEFLKRRVRNQVHLATQWGELGGSSSRSRSHFKLKQQLTPPRSVAVMLSQILYERRGFPWYAFCVVAGLAPTKHHHHPHDDNEDDVSGQVFVFDAIGSFEQVSVACTGGGKELMQPILDRSFDDEVRKTETTIIAANDPRDGCSVEALTMNPPMVQQTAQEAANILIRAFRAVAERQVTVGDHVVLLCMQKKRGHLGNDAQPHEDEEGVEYWTMASPLKLD